MRPVSTPIIGPGKRARSGHGGFRCPLRGGQACKEKTVRSPLASCEEARRLNRQRATIALDFPHAGPRLRYTNPLMALRHKGWFRRFDAALAALMVSASAVSGHAEPPPAARSRVAFSAAPGCPGWAEFAAEVAQRTNASIVPSAFGRGDYAVWLFPAEGGYAGRLYSERHQRVVKDVTADRCEETATALA